jgi:hypothetical protein
LAGLQVVQAPRSSWCRTWSSAMKIRVTKTRKGGQSVSKHHAADATRAAAKRIRTKPDRARAPVVSAAPASDQKRPTGKLGHVLDAVAANRGASLAELVELTGWHVV